MKRPAPFGAPEYPAFDFHIGFGTVQVVPTRPNVALYGASFKKFKRWMDQVEKFTKQELEARR